MYTSHGHHIAGTSYLTPAAANVVRCGGPGMCSECSVEAGMSPPLPDSFDMSKSRDLATGVIRNNQTLTDLDILKRFGFHPGTDDTIPRHRIVRKRFIELVQELDHILPPGRAKAEFLTCLETAAMWANKAVAELAPVEDK